MISSNFVKWSIIATPWKNGQQGRAIKRTSKMFQVLLGDGLVLFIVFILVGHVVAQTCVEPPTGLVGWWPLDEMSGTTATDIISSNDGTLVGAPTPVTGNVAGALRFDGIDDEVFVNSTFPFHQPGDATLEFWLNTPATGHQSVFWTRADDEDANRFNIAVNGDSTFSFDYRSPSGELHILVGICCTGVSIPRNMWTHLAITRTGNVYNLYVNGTLAASATDTLPDLPTAMGWQMSGRGGFMYNGSLDEIALYNRALSGTEIQAIFDAGSAGKCRLVNDFVTFEPLPSTYQFTTDITGCPAGFVGIFSFNAKLTNISDRSLALLAAQVTTLTNGNLLLNADGGPGGVGVQLTVPRLDGFTDGVLSAEESVDVPFAICLQEQSPFSFFVDVLGVISTPATQTQVLLPYLSPGYRFLVVPLGDGVGFEQPDFDDSHFEVDDAAFGTGGFCPLDSTVQTPWPLETDSLAPQDLSITRECQHSASGGRH